MLFHLQNTSFTFHREGDAFLVGFVSISAHLPEAEI
jgi:hypothetical protein